MSGRRQGSGRRWVERQRRDVYVRQAHEKGYRSRAVFKLIELDRRNVLFRTGQCVVDLGAAPGGWSQYAAERVGPSGLVVAVDVTPMDSIPGVDMVEVDITRTGSGELIRRSLQDRQVDLVISDMAPRMSGVVSRDQALALELAEAALKVAGCLLTHHGTLLVKVFEGETTTAFRHQVQERFERHVSRKPAASRNESRERYVIATNPLTGPPSGLEKQ
ncbi:MAG TPA: RlmE family RNA methyltransferase [Gammaproteobacteria bacterium]|nr:RlmE family RNA methyltransferase [Gammaproteobacteria bacterium]